MRVDTSRRYSYFFLALLFCVGVTSCTQRAPSEVWVSVIHDESGQVISSLFHNVSARAPIAVLKQIRRAGQSRAASACQPTRAHFQQLMKHGTVYAKTPQDCGERAGPCAGRFMYPQQMACGQDCGGEQYTHFRQDMILADDPCAGWLYSGSPTCPCNSVCEEVGCSSCGGNPK